MMRRLARPVRLAAWIVGAYVLLGLLWIGLSDGALAWLAGYRFGDVITLANLGKGLAFVLVSGLGLFLAIWSVLAREGSAEDVVSGSWSARPSIGGRLVLAVTMLVSVIGLGWGTYHVQHQSAQRQAVEDITRSAVLKGGLLDRWLEERRDDAFQLAGSRGFAWSAMQAIEEGSLPALEQVVQHLDLLRQHSGYTTIVLLDRELNPVVGSEGPDATDVPMPVDVVSALEQARESGEVGLPRLHADAEGQPLVSLAVPIQDRAARDRPVAALALLSARAERLRPLLTLAEGGERPPVVTYVVMREGEQWGAMVRLDVSEGRLIEPPDTFEDLRVRMLEQPPGHGVWVEDFSGASDSFMAGVQSLEPPGWDLVLTRDLTALAVLPRQQGVWVAGATLLVWLLVLGTGGLIWRSQWLQWNLNLVRQQSEQDHLLARFFEMPFVGMAISRAGASEWERVNGCLAQMLGYTPEQLVRLDWECLSVPEDRGLDAALDAAMHSGERDGYSIEKRLLHSDGRVIVVAIHVRCTRQPDGTVDRTIATFEDITEHRAEEERRRLSSVVFENTGEGVLITDPSAHILSVNRAFTEVMGYTADEVIGRSPKMFRSGWQEPAFYTEMYRRLEAEGYWQGEIWNRRKNGEVFPELLTITAVRDRQGRLTHYVAVFADLSQLKASETERDFLAHYDPLTELPNRRLLQVRLSHAISMVNSGRGLFALLIVGIDRFKDVNASQGYPVGDRLLKEVGARLCSGNRADDTVARLVSDEFAVLVENLEHPDDAALVAEDVIRRVAHPSDLGGGVEIEVSVSVGIVLYQDGADAETLLQQAGVALARTKEDNRGGYYYYSDEFTQAARERIDLSARLRRAIEQDRLEVHFQPQYTVQDQRLVGAEALLRWNDPDLGQIPPGRFIPVAEQTGLIVDLGRWVLQRVIALGAQWRADGLPSVPLAVNISLRQFQEVLIDQQILELLDEYAYPAHLLELEITESMLMTNLDRTHRVLQRLHDHGVRFAVDDFGTGYSSMSQIKNLPMDTLKIDRSFIDDLGEQGVVEDQSITYAIIALGHSIGVSVLAEGVETQGQLEVLRRFGCDCFQGYYANHPLPVSEFVQVLADSEIDPGADSSISK